MFSEEITGDLSDQHVLKLNEQRAQSPESSPPLPRERRLVTEREPGCCSVQFSPLWGLGHAHISLHWWSVLGSVFVL